MAQWQSNFCDCLFEYQIIGVEEKFVKEITRCKVHADSKLKPWELYQEIHSTQKILANLETGEKDGV